jgi:predicted N-acyltransferase
MRKPKTKWVGLFISFLVGGSLSYPLKSPSTPSRKYNLSTSRISKPRFREHELSLGAVKKILDGEDIMSENIQFELHSSILEIRAEDWDGCLANDGTASPFMEHSWLRCLEESKCASPETGWMPQHVAIKIDGDICGFVPLYIKTNSMGEFIFDNGWAEAANANGIDYYPKFLVGVPFTPATGHRILLHPRITEKYSRSKIAELRKMVAIFLKGVARSSRLSSVHMNFLMEEEATDIAGKPEKTSRASYDQTLEGEFNSILKRLQYVDVDGYIRRTSLQYHWSNSNSKNSGLPYKTFDEYLSCFKSKRRIAIRRERKKVQVDKDIRIDAVVGKDILKYDGLVERMFQIYLSTVNKMFWGRQYLSLEFFSLLARSDFVDNLCFMCARRRSAGETLQAADVFAGTFNIVNNGVFYGRYWGCLEEVKSLHFETCYWAAIEYCIKNGLQRMEPGAGGGGKK